MAKAKTRGGLGKGLSALIPTDDRLETQVAAGGGAQQIALSQIAANPYQPRRVFEESQLRDLAESIREHGVVQPVLVRPLEGGFQLIAGERRVRAARLAGLQDIPGLIREMTDHQMMEVALIENIQRQDLNPVEEAQAYRRLAREFGQTQEQISRRVSKSRSHIANSMRLLNLPEPILTHLASGALSAGHVRPLLMLGEQEALTLAARLIAEGATAREAETWAKQLAAPSVTVKLPESRPEAKGEAGESPGKQAVGHKPGLEEPDRALPTVLREIQRLIREAVKTKVEIVRSAKGGKIIIDYYTQDDLERILELLAADGMAE